MSEIPNRKILTSWFLHFGLFPHDKHGLSLIITFHAMFNNCHSSTQPQHEFLVTNCLFTVCVRVPPYPLRYPELIPFLENEFVCLTILVRALGMLYLEFCTPPRFTKTFQAGIHLPDYPSSILCHCLALSQYNMSIHPSRYGVSICPPQDWHKFPKFAFKDR